jgi:putative transposase
MESVHAYGPEDAIRCHECMHRTLKAETTRPAAATCRAQQRKFNRFREEFNRERPHEALDMQTPASCYEASPGRC